MSSIVVVYLFIFFITCVTKFCICFELVSYIKKPQKKKKKQKCWKIRRVCLFVFSTRSFFYTKFSFIWHVCVCVCVLGVAGMPWVMRGHPCQTVDMWHKSWRRNWKALPMRERARKISKWKCWENCWKYISAHSCHTNKSSILFRVIVQFIKKKSTVNFSI